MKKVTGLLILASLVIAGCMIYLLSRGGSLRSAVMIRPSVLHETMDETARGVFARLFPDFQNRQLLVIGVDEPSPRVQEFIAKLKTQSEAFHKNKIITYDDEQLLTAAPVISDCNKNCWVITETQSTSDIAPMPSVLELAGLAEKDRFTISIIEFSDYDQSVIAQCEEQKRLTLDCLKNLAIKEAQRKMKDPAKKYFFMRQYNTRDYFLFFQR